MPVSSGTMMCNFVLHTNLKNALHYIKLMALFAALLVKEVGSLKIRIITMPIILITNKL